MVHSRPIRLFAILAALSSCQTLAVRSAQRELQQRRDAGLLGADDVPTAEHLLSRAERRGNTAATIRAGLWLAQAQRAAGDFAGAAASSQRMVALAEPLADTDSALAADVIHELAAAQERLAPSEAQKLYERALTLRETRVGADDPDLTQELEGLAWLHFRQGKYSDAQEQANRALAIRRRTGGTGPDLAKTLRLMGAILNERGQYAESTELLNESLSILEKTRGPDHPETASTLQSRGKVELVLGNYSQAAADFERSLGIFERRLGSDHYRTEAVRHDLAYVSSYQGNTDRARTLYRQLLTDYERRFGPDHVEVGRVLSDMAFNEYSAYEFEMAERLSRRAVAILEKGYGPESNAVAVAVLGLAQAYGEDEQPAEAAALEARALGIFERTLGPDHERVGSTLARLGASLRRLARFEEAEAAVSRAARIFEKSLGPAHPFVTAQLANVMELEMSRHNYGEAKRLAEAFLRLVGPDHPSSAGPWLTLGYAEANLGHRKQAEEAFRTAVEKGAARYDSSHRILSAARMELGKLAWSRRDIAAALTYFTQAVTAVDARVGRSLGAVSERRQVELLGEAATAMDAVVSFDLASKPGDRDPASRALAYQAVLSRKGRSLEASADQWEQARRRANPEDLQRLEELRSVRRQISELAYESSEPSPEERLQRIDEFEKKRAALEDAMVDRLPLPTISTVRPRDIAAHLPADTALVDLVRYAKPRSLLGDGATRSDPRYAAYVIFGSGEIRARDLGSAQTIDRAVAALRDALVHPEDPRLPERARALDRLVFEPIAPFVRGKTHLLVSPDGPLNVVPFGALIDEQGRYRLQRFEVSYLDSARDLVRHPLRSALVESALVIGAPDFSRAQTNVARTQPEADETPESSAVAIDVAAGDTLADSGQRSHDWSRAGGRFEALPGAEEELSRVASLLGVKPMLGAAASEEAIKAAHGPRVLHVATHAFFLEDKPKLERQGRATQPKAGTQDLAAAFENPLLRSGLVFAGANRLADGGEDGVLTALEASALDLAGTELLVLSACDTGLGEVRDGDGVYGLRRAFTLAGARSQVMSLWKVNDEATRRLMSEYYQRLLRGEGRSEALRQVQLAMLRDPVLRSPYYWAGFVLSGDWRALPSSGDDAPASQNR